MVSAVGLLVAFAALCTFAIAALLIGAVALFLLTAKKSLSQLAARLLHR